MCYVYIVIKRSHGSISYQNNGDVAGVEWFTEEPGGRVCVCVPRVGLCLGVCDGMFAHTPPSALCGSRKYICSAQQLLTRNVQQCGLLHLVMFALIHDCDVASHLFNTTTALQRLMVLRADLGEEGRNVDKLVTIQKS